MTRKFNELLKASFKSDDTEEWLDVHFTRPIGLAFALMWEKLHVHPNVVTVIGIALGVCSGVMFYFSNLWCNVAAVLLMMFSNFCDSTDGQLARLTGQKTLIGRMLDGLSADITFVVVYFAIALRLWHQEIPFTDVQWGWIGLAMCALSGLGGHSPQCLLADYYRQIHLYFLLGKNGSELSNSKAQRAIYESLPKKGNFWARKFYYNYANYCRTQEKRTPAFQKFFGHVREKYPEVESMPQSLRDDFRHGSLPLMKYTNLLTFNTRAIALYIACLIDLPYLYPLFEIIVLTAMYVYMHRSHEAMCTRLDSKYFG